MAGRSGCIKDPGDKGRIHGGNTELLKKEHILPFVKTIERSAEFYFEYDVRHLELRAILEALYFQLGERLLFVKPKDPVVADLLYCLATIEAKTRILEPAVELLAMAREYGYHDVATLDAERARCRRCFAQRGRSMSGRGCRRSW